MKVARVTITGRIPSKKNSKVFSFRGKRPVLLPSPSYRKWHKNAVTEVLGQKKKAIYGILGIRVNIWLPDNRRCDITNKIESVMDLLVDCKILSDDRWQITGPLYLTPMGIDKERPRAEVYIYHDEKVQ